MSQYCDWCEEKGKPGENWTEVGNDYVCESCAKDLRPVHEQPTRLHNVAEKFGYAQEGGE